MFAMRYAEGSWRMKGNGKARLAPSMMKKKYFAKIKETPRIAKDRKYGNDSVEKKKEKRPDRNSSVGDSGSSSEASSVLRTAARYTHLLRPSGPPQLFSSSRAALGADKAWWDSKNSARYTPVLGMRA